MGRIFITDEVRDDYTARVTNAGKIKVETGAKNYFKMTSAETDVSGQTAASACYLHGVFIGEMPATAACLTIVNTVDCAGSVCAFGSSGDNIAAQIVFDVGGASAAACALGNLITSQKPPMYIPLNMYMASGVTLSNSTANNAAQWAGVLRNVTVFYE